MIDRKLPADKKRPVYYLDETGVWQNSARHWSWFSAEEYRQPLKTKSSKGYRFNVMHAGSRDGWIKSDIWIKLGKKVGDFHGTITYGVFEEWVKKQLLPAIEGKRAYIVMDNAGFHRKMAVSRHRMTKKMMQDHLRQHRIDFDDKLVKKKLLEIID
jgi:hypothetical protein